jgi:hypothetical protein
MVAETREVGQLWNPPYRHPWRGGVQPPDGCRSAQHAERILMYPETPVNTI